MKKIIYKDLYNFCRNNNIEFVWITDGDGWKTTKKPLRETFELTDYILNLNMIKEGCLDEILKKCTNTYHSFCKY